MATPNERFKEMMKKGSFKHELADDQTVARRAAVVALYARGVVSLGKAVELVGPSAGPISKRFSRFDGSSGPTTESNSNAISPGPSGKGKRQKCGVGCRLRKRRARGDWRTARGAPSLPLVGGPVAGNALPEAPGTGRPVVRPTLVSRGGRIVHPTVRIPAPRRGSRPSGRRQPVPSSVNIGEICGLTGPGPFSARLSPARPLAIPYPPALRIGDGHSFGRGGDAVGQAYGPAGLAFVHAQDHDAPGGRMVGGRVEQEEIRTHLGDVKGVAVDQKVHFHRGGVAALGR